MRVTEAEVDSTPPPSLIVSNEADGDTVRHRGAVPTGSRRPLRSTFQSTDDNEDDAASEAPTDYTVIDTASVSAVVWQRTSVLVSLLLLQSLSQFILESFETLISHHVIIPLFLTMLVGAGGNAGNQSAVRAITGLVTKEFRQKDYLLVLRKEFVVGFINSLILALIGFGRVYYFYGHHDLFYSTVAITMSLFCIVLSSVILGTSLPFLIGWIGLDREHAAPIIQVVMDITGVLITCMLCSMIIPSSEGRAKAAGSAAPPSPPTSA